MSSTSYDALDATTTAPGVCFTLEERNAIIGAALAVSARWGVSFDLTDAGAEVAAVGRQSGGDSDTWDAYGLAILKGGLVELADFREWGRTWIFSTVAQAAEAMRQDAEAAR